MGSPDITPGIIIGKLEAPQETIASQRPDEDQASRVNILGQLHGITPEQIRYFKEAIPLANYYNGVDPVIMLDLAAGTGFVAEQIAQHAIDTGIPVTMHTIEINHAMNAVARARIESFLGVDPSRRDLFSMLAHDGDITTQGGIERLAKLREASVDIVSIKMGLHEMPMANKRELLKDVYRVLKPGGRLVSWDVFVPERTNGTPAIEYTRFIAEKDRIAGRGSMAIRREFHTKGELKRLLTQAGFNQEMISMSQYSWVRTWDTIERWFFELGNENPSNLIRLNQAATDYIGRYDESMLGDSAFTGTLREYMDLHYTNGGFDGTGIDPILADRQYVVTGYSFEIGSGISIAIKK